MKVQLLYHFLLFNGKVVARTSLQDNLNACRLATYT
jgi:hypothetical protein